MPFVAELANLVLGQRDAFLPQPFPDAPERGLDHFRIMPPLHRDDLHEGLAALGDDDLLASGCPLGQRGELVLRLENADLHDRAPVWLACWPE